MKWGKEFVLSPEAGLGYKVRYVNHIRGYFIGHTTVSCLQECWYAWNFAASGTW